MKAKVIESFRDKNTYIFHKVNSIIEVSEERFKELSARVEEVKEAKKEKVSKDK